jgi:hypothetical protein
MATRSAAERTRSGGEPNHRTRILGDANDPLAESPEFKRDGWSRSAVHLTEGWQTDPSPRVIGIPVAMTRDGGWM